MAKFQITVLAILGVIACIVFTGVGIAIFMLAPVRHPAPVVTVVRIEVTVTPTATFIPTRTPRPATPTPDIEANKATWGEVDIRALVKNPDRYIGSQVHYRGEVFSIEEDGRLTVIQVWVDVPGSDYGTEAVIVGVEGYNTDNIFEGTTIEFWGYGVGELEGTNAFGAAIQQPMIEVEYLTYFR